MADTNNTDKYNVIHTNSSNAGSDEASAISPEPCITVNELSGLKLFSGESPDMLDGIVDICTMMHAAKDEVLLEPGQSNSHLYLIIEGRVKVQLNKNDEPLTLLQAGDCFGELSIIGNTNVSAWVVADHPSRLARIPAPQVWTLINRSANVPRNLLRVMCSRIRQSNTAISESLQKQQQYERESRVDILTGLYNRRWLEEMLPRYVRRYQYDVEPVTIIMVDVDHFKLYNDKLGHTAGDRALAAVAHTIMENIRPGDAAVRYGGEEFMVILPETSNSDAHIVAERLRNAIAHCQISDSETGTTLPSVTASLGVATLKEGLDGTELIKRADAALYQAKNQGRNCVCSE